MNHSAVLQLARDPWKEGHLRQFRGLPCRPVTAQCRALRNDGLRTALCSNRAALECVSADGMSPGGDRVVKFLPDG